MARTIKIIQESIIASLNPQGNKLSDSASAEWRLWTYIVAVAIHAFEVVLDLFTAEIEVVVRNIPPGTDRWYAEMCRRFQFGHQLKSHPKTAVLYYEQDDPAARIVKAAAVNTVDRTIYVKAAKTDETGHYIPLSADEMRELFNYMTEVAFAGYHPNIISHYPDVVKYDIEVFYDPSSPVTVIDKNVAWAMELFKAEVDFDAKFYPYALAKAIGKVEGVVTVEIHYIGVRSFDAEEYTEVDIVGELSAGYFEYAEDSVTKYTNINTI
jgi:hypothetical protein